MPQPPPIKDFSALKPIAKALQAKREQAAREVAAERLAQAARQREANVFRDTMKLLGDVEPIVPLREATRRARVRHVPPLPAPDARQMRADEAAALLSTLSDDITPETLLETDAALSFCRDGISPQTVRKLRQGKWVIQDQLDLHGLTRDEAREELVVFLNDAQKRGLRCVRVVHGKGLGSLNREPVLKGRVRHWLTQRDDVLAFTQARAQDGGSGALVVLLRGTG
jgi:DNA-nicking Smr family endonuclease